MKRIKGIIAAPFTGFANDESVDLSRIRLQKEFYKANGVVGVFICGSTGEGSSMTFDEKIQIYKEWAKYREEDFAVIAFLGGTSIKECQELAQCAMELKLDGVAVTAPYYFKPASVAVLSDFCQQVAAATPQLPFYYYHIPSLTGVNFSMYELLQKMDGTIPNLAGIKYTFENLMDYQLCLEFKERRYNIMWGRDEMLLPALSFGATTFVGSTFGYQAPVYHKIMDSFNEGDICQAAKYQLKANRLITLLGKYGSGCGKAFMKLTGVDLGPCRLPLQTLSDEEFSRLAQDAKEFEFDTYKSIKN